MVRRTAKLARELITLLSRLRDLEQRSEDTQVELQQLTSLLHLSAGLPAIPPKRLQLRVAGAYRGRFLLNGKDLIGDIEDLLNTDGASLLNAESILDFGCGCGRLLIPLSFMIDPARICGTDIDKQPIKWLRENYPAFKALDVNKVNPPTKYADASFDVIYGVSVFTHLPEDMQHAWLSEISRILKPGGHGVFTTHGETFYNKLPSLAFQEVKDRGFHYSAGDVTEGLPEFYQTSFQSHEYIQREWNKHFDVVAIREKGIAKSQDAVLVRRRESLNPAN